MELAAEPKDRILVVDDEPLVLRALHRLLDDEFEVLTASSGAAALAVVRDCADITVLMTDQRMPGCSGDELLARLPGTCDAQRIVLTGSADLAVVARALDAGPLFAFLQKPWQPAELLDKVRCAAGQHRYARKLARDRQLLHDLLEQGFDRSSVAERGPKSVEAGRAVRRMVGRVADRVRTQRAFEVSEAILHKQTGLLHAILHGLAEGVVVADVCGNFLLCNPKAQRMLGLHANALSVGTWIMLCHVYDANDVALLPEALDPLAAAIRGAPLCERLVCLRGIAGARAHVNVSAMPLRDDRGEVLGGVALLCDVTATRRIEDRLHETHQTDALGRLAGGVAHDFNNLLSVIQTCGELLSRQLPRHGPQRAELSQIMHASERAAILTRQLLAFSRQERVHPQKLQLNEVVVKIDTLLQRVIGEHIEIVTQLEPEVGLVSIDPTQLEQVILNLAVNARDAMPEGGELRIETRNIEGTGDGDDRFVLLAIHDSGDCCHHGCHRAEPLFATREFGPIGLGMATVYGIVEQNGGRVRCNPSPDGGTTIEIYLKRVELETEEPRRITASTTDPRKRRASVISP